MVFSPNKVFFRKIKQIKFLLYFLLYFGKIKIKCHPYALHLGISTNSYLSSLLNCFSGNRIFLIFETLKNRLKRSKTHWETHLETHWKTNWQTHSQACLNG
jgi:hypothetical protein